MSMSIGGYSTSYSGDFLYTVEGDSGPIPFNKKSDFGAAVEYSRVISSRFTLDSSFSYYSRTNKVKSTTCRDSSTNVPVSCNVSLNSRFRALSIFGTYRHPIGLFSKVYLGSGISINKLEQEISVKADGYEEKSISTKSSSLKTNLGFKLGASYKNCTLSTYIWDPLIKLK